MLAIVLAGLSFMSAAAQERTPQSVASGRSLSLLRNGGFEADDACPIHQAAMVPAAGREVVYGSKRWGTPFRKSAGRRWARRRRPWLSRPPTSVSSQTSRAMPRPCSPSSKSAGNSSYSTISRSFGAVRTCRRHACDHVGISHQLRVFLVCCRIEERPCQYGNARRFPAGIKLVGRIACVQPRRLDGQGPMFIQPAAERQGDAGTAAAVQFVIAQQDVRVTGSQHAGLRSRRHGCIRGDQSRDGVPIGPQMHVARVQPPSTACARHAPIAAAPAGGFGRFDAIIDLGLPNLRILRSRFGAGLRLIASTRRRVLVRNMCRRRGGCPTLRLCRLASHGPHGQSERTAGGKVDKSGES